MITALQAGVEPTQAAPAQQGVETAFADVFTAALSAEIQSEPHTELLLAHTSQLSQTSAKATDTPEKAEESSSDEPAECVAPFSITTVPCTAATAVPQCEMSIAPNKAGQESELSIQTTALRDCAVDCAAMQNALQDFPRSSAEVLPGKESANSDSPSSTQVEPGTDRVEHETSRQDNVLPRQDSRPHQSITADVFVDVNLTKKTPAVPVSVGVLLPKSKSPQADSISPRLVQGKVQDASTSSKPGPAPETENSSEHQSRSVLRDELPLNPTFVVRPQSESPREPASDKESADRVYDAIQQTRDSQTHVGQKECPSTPSPIAASDTSPVETIRRVMHSATPNSESQPGAHPVPISIPDKAHGTPEDAYGHGVRNEASSLPASESTGFIEEAWKAATPGAARLVSRLEHQELRFGWTIQDLGRVEVRTTLEHNRVEASVSVPDAHVCERLQTEMGTLDRALADHSLELFQFSAFDSSTSQRSSRDTQELFAGKDYRPARSEPVPIIRSATNASAHSGLLDLRA